MRLDLFFRTYNEFGSNRVLMATTSVLMEGYTATARSLREVEIQLWIPSGRRPRTTLEELSTQFDVTRQTLPTSRFRRIKRAVEICISSEFTTGAELKRLRVHQLHPPPEVVRTIGEDCVRALEFGAANVPGSAAEVLLGMADHFRERAQDGSLSAEAIGRVFESLSTNADER